MDGISKRALRLCWAGATALSVALFSTVAFLANAQIAETEPPNAEAIPLPPLTDRAEASELQTLKQPPASFRAWWDDTARLPIVDAGSRLEIPLAEILVGTLRCSPHVRMLYDTPAIQQANVCEAEAQFDWRTFMESKFIDTSDPVGSTLTTGGPPRYLDQNWYYSGGMRRQTISGARIEAAQKFGYEDSNSVFFVPDQQGTARMSLSLAQPLLYGRGSAYTTHLIVLAQIDTQVARDRVARDLQDLLVEVHRAYWDLYLQRALLLQKRKLFRQAVEIHEELHGRREIDVLQSQIARAKAAVATRLAAVIRQETAVGNAQSRLVTLVGDPSLNGLLDRELIPIERPQEQLATVDLQQSLITAVQYRPEINQVAHEIKAAGLRLNVSKHELMPVLNFILTSYVSGLQGDADIGGAFGDQFSEGRPTYSAGLLFEYPLGNRAAQARLKKRQLELRQITNQLALTTANVRLDVETAVREIETAHREMISHSHAIGGGEAEIEYLNNRWRLLPGDQQTAGLVLDDLLNAQERLSRSEASYVSAIVGYNLAFVQWKRATGVLFDMQAIDARCGKSVLAPLASSSSIPRAKALQAPVAFTRGRRAIEAVSQPARQSEPRNGAPQESKVVDYSEYFRGAESDNFVQPLPAVVEMTPHVGSHQASWR
jgi:outer membrane protein TolC